MAESLWRVRRGKGHQIAAAACLSGTGPLQRRSPLAAGCPGPGWPAETAAAAGCDGDGDDASSLSHPWAAGRSVSSGGGAPRPAAPPPGQKWQRCRWRRRWCWGSNAGGSPAWQSPAPELLRRREAKGGEEMMAWGLEAWSWAVNCGTKRHRCTHSHSHTLWAEDGQEEQMKPCEAHWLLLSFMFKDLTLDHQEREQAEEQTKPLWGKKKQQKKQHSQQVLIKQHVRGCTGEDRRQKLWQMTMFVPGDQAEELKVHREGCGQRLERQQTARCLKWQKQLLQH